VSRLRQGRGKDKSAINRRTSFGSSAIRFALVDTLQFALMDALEDCAGSLGSFLRPASQMLAAQ
jgi:hypothetical protein